MLDEVFQGIYSSVVEAQNTIEQHYLGEITEDYFLEDGTPKMIIVKLPAADGKLKEVHYYNIVDGNKKIYVKKKMFSDPHILELQEFGSI